MFDPSYIANLKKKIPKKLSPEALERIKTKIQEAPYIKGKPPVAKVGEKQFHSRISYSSSIMSKKTRERNKVRQFILNDGTIIKAFLGFRQQYPVIYKWWLLLLNRSLNARHPWYIYYGGKGIPFDAEFMDSKNFCIWALENNLYDSPLCYNQYLFRKDKSKGYSRDNIIITSELEMISGSSLTIALLRIFLTQKYEEYHHPSVALSTFYARCFVYDLDVDTARKVDVYSAFQTKTHPKNKNKDVNAVIQQPSEVASCMRFSPVDFYKAMADESSCTLSQFIARYSEARRDGIKERPYDMLKPTYSNTEYSNANGKLSHEQKMRFRNKYGRNEITSKELYEHIEKMLIDNSKKES